MGDGSHSGNTGGAVPFVRARRLTLKTFFMDLLFPPRCVVCRARGEWLCLHCRPQLDLFQPPLCPRCGLPVEPNEPCSACRWERVPLNGKRACGYFEGPLRQAVHRLKFNGERYLAEPLAAIMAETWRQSPPPVDILVPVPLGKKRERERGYNQSALLAAEVGRLLGLPVDEQTLRRVRETPPQMGLPRESRLANLEGAFACQPDPIAGRRVCLIDDVTTTGATLAACASTLRRAGARAVCGLTVAKTR